MAKRYAKGGKPSDSYVLVTGATSEGIGFAFAEEFVDRGFNVALVGRSPSKLLNCKNKLEARASKGGLPVNVLTIEADVGNVGGKEDGALDAIAAATEGIDVAIVVHAAGVETISNPFTKKSLDFNRQAVNVNAVAPVLLTQLLLPQLTKRIESSMAGRSAVIFIGAGLALRPTPGVNIYAATKSMENFFAQAVGVESKSAVDSLIVHPLGVSTKLIGGDGSGGFVEISPQRCARATLRQLGHSWAREWTNGWWVHEMQWAVMKHAPNFIYNKIWMDIAPWVMEQRMQAYHKLNA